MDPAPNARLIAAPADAQSAYRAGIEIKLADGIAALTAQRFADVVTRKRLPLDNQWCNPRLDKVKGGS